MARKKQKAQRKQPAAPATRGGKKAAAPARTTEAAEAPAPARRREIRPYVYAGFDVGIAALWSFLLTTQLESRHGWASAMLWGMVLMAVAMAAAMFVRNKWGWRAAAVCCGALLLVWLFLLVVLLTSASYLAGVYGSFGHAAAMGALAIAAITVEVVALVPALQLKFLMTRAGRRYFGQEPLG